MGIRQIVDLIMWRKKMGVARIVDLTFWKKIMGITRIVRDSQLCVFHFLGGNKGYI